MAAPMEKVKKHPGIYRRGGRYVFSYRVNGKQRWESARTLDEARKLKATKTADLARGEFTELSALTLHEYAREWIERYQGTGRRGFREETRGEYGALLEKYALTYFSEGTGLSELTPLLLSSDDTSVVAIGAVGFGGTGSGRDSPHASKLASRALAGG